MTRRTRRIVFYILVALFVVVGTGAVLYAEGLRLDFASLKLKKVGGIYVRAFPQGASIALDGTPIRNQSNFLTHGTLISNLFPKSYTLSLTLPGYDAWQERADVEPSLVVEMKYAVLVPNTGTAVATSGDVTDFFAVGNERVETRESGAIVWRGAAVATGTVMSRSSDFKTMVYRTAAGRYMLFDFTTGTSADLTALFEKKHVAAGAIRSIIVNPKNDTGGLALTGSRVWSVDFAGLSVTPIATSSPQDSIAPTLAASQSESAWSEIETASDTSRISVYDNFSGLVIGRVEVPGATQTLGWLSDSSLGILQTNGSLYIYDLPTQALRSIASDVKSFYPSPDGTLVAALERSSLEIFDFADDDYYRFNLPDMATIQGLAWYKDENHLFITYPDRIAFFDLADTSLMNVTPVAHGTDPLYDPQENALYVVQGGNVKRFTFPS
ncbi:MAG TPA: hypothetical protein VMT99_00670 [Candidatus Paceibacterota bacterium]|nr:hypothetical protein [Candidatus Paceibacterota bacterium]